MVQCINTPGSDLITGVLGKDYTYIYIFFFTRCSTNLPSVVVNSKRFPLVYCVGKVSPGRKGVKVAAGKHVIMSPSRLEMEGQKTRVVNTGL